MLIECKITFQKDGFTITQSIDPGAAQSEDVPPLTGKSLKDTFQNSQATSAPAAGAGGAAPAAKKGGPGSSTDPGGGPPSGNTGMAPITVIGPIFFGWPQPSSAPNEKD
jgi:hypothetical protein